MTAARHPMTVIVPTRDRVERLEVALAAITVALDHGDEIIVVDSASRDPSSVASVASAAGARLLRCDQPGASRARNAGWRAARHDYVGFVDDDVRIDAGWAAAMVGCLSSHPEAAFVTGRVDAAGATTTMTVAIKDEDDAAELDGRSGGILGHSASLVVRRDVLVAIGGFDELLGAGARFKAAEDTDLFDRIFAQGRTGRYEPAARAGHEQWRRIRQWVALQHGYGVGGGARLAKLARSDRRRFRLILRDDVWTWGVAQLPGELMRRDGYRALATVLRLLGLARGFVTALVVPVSSGHLRSSSSSS